MQESVAKGICDFIKSQLPEFEEIIPEYYDNDKGFTESLERRLAKVGYDSKLNKQWYSLMWDMGKPDPNSVQGRMFKVKDIQWVNNKGDLIDQQKAQDPVTLQAKPGYKAVSPDYRYSIVQSTFNTDFIFNSTNNASTFQELFVLRIFKTRSVYVNLPILGETCIYIDDIAIGDIEKFDRLSQGTLCSVPVDMILTYPLIDTVLPPKDQPKYTTERKPLITNIQFNQQIVTGKAEPIIKRKRSL